MSRLSVFFSEWSGINSCIMTWLTRGAQPESEKHPKSPASDSQHLHWPEMKEAVFFLNSRRSQENWDGYKLIQIVLAASSFLGSGSNFIDIVCWVCICHENQWLWIGMNWVISVNNSNGWLSCLHATLSHVLYSLGCTKKPIFKPSNTNLASSPFHSWRQAIKESIPLDCVPLLPVSVTQEFSNWKSRLKLTKKRGQPGWTLASWSEKAWGKVRLLAQGLMEFDGILVGASSWWRTYDHLISKICVLCILMQGRKSVCHGILWSVHLHVGGGRWKLTRKCLNTMVTTLSPGYMSSNSTCSSEVHHTQMTLLTNLVFPVSATLGGQNTRYSKSMRVRFLMVYIWPWLIIHSFYPSSRLSVSHQQQPPKKRNKLNPSCALVTRKDQRSRLTFQYNQ